MLVIFMGSLHFFIYNSIQDIMLLYFRPWTERMFRDPSGLISFI